MNAPEVRPLTERELIEQVNTGRNAAELLAEPLIARWFHDLDATVIECIRQASRDGNEKEFAHWSRMLEAQTLMKEAFRHYMQTGQVAASKLKQPGLIRRKISRFKWETTDKSDAA